MKKIYLVTILLIMTVGLAGCGKIKADPENGQPTAEAAAEVPSDSPSLPAASDTPEPKEPSVEKMTADVGYADSEREVAVLGMKEYKKLESKIYTDKPKKGKRFLVLFLKVRNRGYKDDYINVGNLKTELDGKGIETSVLVNQPENYPTLFQSVPGGTDISGFIVWEVPKKWNKLHISYSGWEYSSSVILDIDLTRKNLAAPPKYDS